MWKWNGDVDGEPLCLAITSSLMAALRALNHGDGSANSSSDVDGRVPNCEHRIESEDDMDDVGEAQERSEEGVEMGGCGNL
jgi:hypothetical protein